MSDKRILIRIRVVSGAVDWCRIMLRVCPTTACLQVAVQDTAPAQFLLDAQGESRYNKNRVRGA